MTAKRKPGWAFWTTVVLPVLLVGYPLSAGPAYRLIENPGTLENWICASYQPLFWTVAHFPRSVKKQYEAYLYWWLPGCMIDLDESPPVTLLAPGMCDPVSVTPAVPAPEAAPQP